MRSMVSGVQASEVDQERMKVCPSVISVARREVFVCSVCQESRRRHSPVALQLFALGEESERL